MADITTEKCVLALKNAGMSMKAHELAFVIDGGTDGRAVSAALRKPILDGRVKTERTRYGDFYEFVSLTPKATS
ncbi:hypothetical protein [Rhodoferax sp. TH121]|uniref:hypothetical protein n=1 Tax=Rhodoferax sp. TH121 TaxID=2022803 RepID=UPI001140522A|nr:hypothetical protein [Rhodoferax sp. TH121]